MDRLGKQPRVSLMGSDGDGDRGQSQGLAQLGGWWTWLWTRHAGEELV